MDPQTIIADLFQSLRADGINTFSTTTETRYVSGTINGNKYLFSIQTQRGQSHFIVTKNETYLLVARELSEITTEFQKMLVDPNYTILQNKSAATLASLVYNK